jgi:hypothetical protein
MMSENIFCAGVSRLMNPRHVMPFSVRQTNRPARDATSQTTITIPAAASPPNQGSAIRQ